MAARTVKSAGRAAVWIVDFWHRPAAGPPKRIREVAPVQSRAGAEKHERRLRGQLRAAERKEMGNEQVFRGRQVSLVFRIGDYDVSLVVQDGGKPAPIPSYLIEVTDGRDGHAKLGATSASGLLADAGLVLVDREQLAELARQWTAAIRAVALARYKTVTSETANLDGLHTVFATFDQEVPTARVAMVDPFATAAAALVKP